MSTSAQFSVPCPGFRTLVYDLGPGISTLIPSRNRANASVSVELSRYLTMNLRSNTAERELCAKDSNQSNPVMIQLKRVYEEPASEHGAQSLRASLV